MNVIRQSIITIFLLLWTFGLNGLLLWLVIAHFSVSSQSAPIPPSNVKKVFSVNLVTLPTPASNNTVIEQKEKENTPVKTVSKKKETVKKSNSSPSIVIPKKSKPVVLSKKQHKLPKKPQKTISSSRFDKIRYAQPSVQEKASEEKPLANPINDSQTNVTATFQKKADKKTSGHLTEGQKEKSVVTYVQKKTVPPSFHAAYLQNPPPTYPRLSRLRGEEGKVLLRVKVNEQGTVETLQLNQSSGSARLDQAAYDTVNRWRFVPAQQGGKSVSAWVIVPIVFKLQ